MPRKRLTITLDPSILNQLDNSVDGKVIRNRSHAIENIVQSHFTKNVNTAVILAGGKKQKETPFLKLNDHTLFNYQLKQLLKAGIHEIFLITNLDKEQNKKFLDIAKDLGVKLCIVNEETPLRLRSRKSR